MGASLVSLVAQHRRMVRGGLGRCRACVRAQRGTEIELERRHLPAGEGVFELHVHPLTILCTMGVVFWSLAASWARASVAPSKGMRGTNVQRWDRQTDERSFCWCSWWAGSSPRSPHGQKKRRGVGLRRQRAGRPESAPRLIVMSLRGRATIIVFEKKKIPASQDLDFQAPPPTLLGQLFGIRRLFVFHLKREYIFFVVAYYNRLQKQLRGAPSVVRPVVAFHRT